MKKIWPFSLGIPAREKILFARHLSVMIGAGFPLIGALKVLILQTENTAFKKILTSIKEEVKRGSSLAESLGLYPQVFERLFINMVHVGEMGGNLAEVLELIARHLEKQADLRSAIRGAMIYPATVLCIMTGVGVFMLIFVIPKLTKTLKEFQVELPLLTRAVIGLSDFIAQNIWWLIIAVIGLFLLFRKLKKRPYFQRLTSGLVLNLPIIKNLVKKVNVAFFAWTFGALLEAGVAVVEALENAAETVSNFYYRQSLRKVAKRLQKGEKLRQNLSLYENLYPPLVTQMIGVGEETGSLADVLKKLSLFYEKEVAKSTKNLTSIIEPLLIALIGGLVGLFAVAMMQPMFAMMGGIQ